MFILMLLLAIVLILLLVKHIHRTEVIHTALYTSAAAKWAELQVPAPVEAEPQAPVEEPQTQPEQAPETTPAAEPAAAQVTGTAVDTGTFRTICPEGWLYLPMTDVFGEQDENGNYPPDPTRMGFCKGATVAADVFSKLTVYAYYMNQPYSESTLENAEMWYTETENFTTMINGVECQGFHAKDEDLFTEGQFYEYDTIFLPVDDGHYIQFQIMTAAPNVTETITRDDADVQTILSNTAID